MNTTPSDLFQLWLVRSVEARRLSHAQLALRSGIDRSTIGRILAGQRRPSLDTAIHLVEALEARADVPPALHGVLGAAGPLERVARALEDDRMLDASAIDRLLACYRRIRAEARTKPVTPVTDDRDPGQLPASPST